MPVPHQVCIFLPHLSQSWYESLADWLQSHSTVVDNIGAVIGSAISLLFSLLLFLSFAGGVVVVDVAMARRVLLRCGVVGVDRGRAIGQGGEEGAP